jgi:ATP-dependent Clp protease ATP-binding subunit ClpA
MKLTGPRLVVLPIVHRLKPLLARGKLRLIGATTLNEYREHIEKDSAFERRFAQVLVNEPSVPATVVRPARLSVSFLPFDV